MAVKTSTIQWHAGIYTKEKKRRRKRSEDKWRQKEERESGDTGMEFQAVRQRESTVLHVISPDWFNMIIKHSDDRLQAQPTAIYLIIIIIIIIL